MRLLMLLAGVWLLASATVHAMEPADLRGALALGDDGQATAVIAVAQRALGTRDLAEPGSGATTDRAAASLAGGVTPTLGAAQLARLSWHDLGEIVIAPASWSHRQWRVAGALTLATIGAAAMLDQPVRDAAQRSQIHSRDSFARHIERFGAQYGVASMLALYGYGRAAGDAAAQGTALDAGIASLIAAGVLTPALKASVGRARPHAGQGRYRFRPFHGDASFPSGHATEAFVLASVVSAHSDSPWIGAGAYGLAGLVGAARVYRDAHWVSDVLAGAALGTFVGRRVVHLNGGPSGRAQLAPAVILGVPGIAVSVAF